MAEYTQLEVLNIQMLQSGNIVYLLHLLRIKGLIESYRYSIFLSKITLLRLKHNFGRGFCETVLLGYRDSIELLA